MSEVMDTAQQGNGNGRLARMESDISYLRRDTDVMRDAVRLEVSALRTEFNARLDKIETNISWGVRLALGAVILMVLANIGIVAP